MKYTLRQLSGKSALEIIKELRGLPKDITALDLSVNFLGLRTVPELRIIFAAIPSSVTTLDLGVNLFDKLTCASLAEVFSTIPVSVISINLGGNNLFFNKSRIDLSMIFASIPAGLISIGLSYNNFDCKSMAAVISLIPPSISSIDFRGSNLGEEPIKEIIQFIRLIPRHVRDLDLGESFINERSNAEIEKITAVIPPGIRLNIGWYNHPIIKESVIRLPSVAARDLAPISGASGAKAAVKLPSVVESSAGIGVRGAKPGFFGAAIEEDRPSTASQSAKLPVMMGTHASRR